MFSTKTTLAKLIEISQERDASALEGLLIQAILDLIAAKAVVLYRLTDTHRANFHLTAKGREVNSDAILPAELKNTLMSCINSANFLEENHAQSGLTFYFPVKGVRNKITAVIAVESPKIMNDLHDIMEMLMQIYQNFTALISDNEHDTLTGLLNRKTFETKITKVFGAMSSTQARQGDQPETSYFLAIFDIDHFKRVNDEFGHLMGDEVLLLFSQLMTKSFREKDLLFRFGGEEFVAVFDCQQVTDMHRALDRFRKKVSEFSFPQVGNVNISAGFTQVRLYDTPGQLIDRADLALYYAKNNGRNRVCSHEALILTGDLKENKIEGDIELF